MSPRYPRINRKTSSNKNGDASIVVKIGISTNAAGNNNVALMNTMKIDRSHDSRSTTRIAIVAQTPKLASSVKYDIPIAINPGVNKRGSKPGNISGFTASGCVD